jgi:hypothetical protein
LIDVSHLLHIYLSHQSLSLFYQILSESRVNHTSLCSHFFTCGVCTVFFLPTFAMICYNVIFLLSPSQSHLQRNILSYDSSFVLLRLLYYSFRWKKSFTIVITFTSSCRQAADLDAHWFHSVVTLGYVDCPVYCQGNRAAFCALPPFGRTSLPRNESEVLVVLVEGRVSYNFFPSCCCNMVLFQRFIIGKLFLNLFCSTMMPTSEWQKLWWFLTARFWVAYIVSYLFVFFDQNIMVYSHWHTQNCKRTHTNCFATILPHTRERYKE